MSDAVSAKAIRKVALTSLAGTSIEWYDFFLYATAAALVFPTVFFPAEMAPGLSLLASFSTFAVGFLARPVGAVVFSHYGDRIGRKKPLVFALLVMGVASTLIGCLPTYETIGAAAPLALIVLRCAQGFAVGGQWAGAVLLITESAPRGKRGFYGSFAQVGAPIGIVLANLAFLLASASMSPESFMSWGWRVPFLLSIALIGLSLYTQLHLEETREFRELQAHKDSQDMTVVARLARERSVAPDTVRTELAAERRSSPVLEALRTYPKQIALAAGAFVAVQVTFYILVAFVVAYGTDPAGLAIPRTTMLGAVLVGAIVMIPALLLSAAISDRYGRRGIYIAGAALLAGWAFALFPLIETRSVVAIIAAIGVGQILVAMMYGPQAAFLSELFSAKVRYSAASLGFQLGAILGGALAPVIATAIVARQGSAFGVSLYIAVACLITIACTLSLVETNCPRMPQ